MTDNDNIRQAQVQMNKSALALAAMSDDVADARQIAHYDSDRRKIILAIAMEPFLAAGDSAAAAEVKARAETNYLVKMDNLAEEYRGAQQVIERANSEQIKFQSSQSILSAEKAKLGLL